MSYGNDHIQHTCDRLGQKTVVLGVVVAEVSVAVEARAVGPVGRGAAAVFGVRLVFGVQLAARGGRGPWPWCSACVAEVSVAVEARAVGPVGRGAAAVFGVRLVFGGQLAARGGRGTGIRG